MQRTPHTPEAIMIKPQDKVFANLTHQLHRDLSLEPLTRIVNLAAVAVGILRSKSLQVGQIVTASPLEGSRDSLKKRVQRFLKNASVSVEEYYQPLAKRILRRLRAGGNPVLRDCAPGVARWAALLVPCCLHPKTCSRGPQLGHVLGADGGRALVPHYDRTDL